MAARGCGSARFSDGIYACCGLSPNGLPIERFLIDPPKTEIPLGVTPRGVALYQDRDSGIWHIIDWVGSEGYPNVADFIEEVRVMGMSRRLPSNLDFSKLTADSKILFVHGRGHIENWREYATPVYECPSHKHEHANYLGTMCSRTYWYDIEGGGRDATKKYAPGQVDREMPSFVYSGYSRPGHITPEYKPAFFMCLPITRLEVVRGEKTGERLTVASKAGIPAVVKEE